MGHALPGGWLSTRFAFALRRLARARVTGPVDATVWGLRLRLHPRGNISEARILFMPKIWDATERALLASRLHPSFVFVDVGANVGGYSLWLASRLGSGGTIVAIEPDPELAARLRFNLGANHLEQVRVLETAVGASAGDAVLVRDTHNRGENRVEEAAPQGTPVGLPVPVRTLADLLQEQGVTRIDALKIDIEGAEVATLEPYFENTDPSAWPGLLIAEAKSPADDARYRALLEPRGYRLLAHTKLNAIHERVGALT